MNRAARRLSPPEVVTPQPEPAAGRLRDVLGELFPVAPEPPARSRGTRALWAAVQVAAVAVAAVTALLRIPGRPAWRTIFGDDYFEFLVSAIQHPWHWRAYGGYVQVLPRFIAQVVSFLPLPDAALALALTGAVFGACCALFIFHASAGHIQSAWLRALLALALVLLPVAPMELIGSGVETPWYLMPTLFWAILWRPRARSGVAVAAAIGFLTAASNILAVLFAPLLAVRLYVLRRPREHAVTSGWLVGCLVQVPFVIWSQLNGHSRLSGRRHATPGQSFAFYAHEVLLPSLGWHLSWWLRSHAGVSAATAIAAAVLAVCFGLILITQSRARTFVVTALVAGVVAAVVSVTISRGPATDPMLPARVFGTRYTVMPDLLIIAGLIVGVDCALRSRPQRRWLKGAGRGTVAAATALVVFLAVTWTVDFRSAGLRSQTAWTWAPIAARWEHDCASSRTGEITEIVYTVPWTLPCRNIHP